MKNDFTFGNRLFRYEFNQLSIAQVALATAVVEFRYYQIQQGQPSTFNEILRAGAINWLPMTVRYLVREIKDEQPQPFNQIKAESEIDKLFMDLNNSSDADNSNFKLMTEVANDFFLRTKKDKMLLSVLTGKRLQKEIEAYTELLTKMQSFAEILTSGKNKSKPSASKKANSKE